MERRGFLRALASALIVPSGIGIGVKVLTSCEEYADDGVPRAPPRKEGTDITYTSSAVDEHEHTFLVHEGQLVSTTPADINDETNNKNGHTHLVSISAADLRRVAAGEEVKINTGFASEHKHTLTLVRV